jgi:oxygen-dependent protoporphyrinogen oxidase
LQEERAVRKTLDAALSRRSFLETALIAGAGMAALGPAAVSAEDGRAALPEMRDIPPERIEPILTFHGEVFPNNPHRMFREGRFPAAPDPDREVDVVIVGGGAGGLTAAYRLKDRNLLLLEALPQLGGNSMYSEWEGMPFSLGGQYIGTRGTWADSVWDLCGELGLEPEKDTSPLAVVFPGNVQVQDPYGLWGLLQMPIPWRVKLDIIRFYLWDMPRIEVEARKDELDRIPFSECMKKYSPEFRDWYEKLAKPYPRTTDASAYYAIKSAQEQDYAGDAGIASLPGGLGLINRTLAQKIEEAGPGRMLTNAFAYRVRHDSEGRVLVTYWHGGRVATVRAKAAIINAEANIATRILEDIPAELKNAMEGMRRFSYPTFHFCSRKPIYQRGYRVGVMDSTIQAITIPDWFSRDRGPNRPNILSCFNKMSLEDVEVVRNREEMVKMSCQVLRELDQRFPGTALKVEAVHVFLRNRNYCVPYPGYITDVFPKLGKPYGSIFFANAEYLNPVTHFPEAVEAGTEAARQVRKLL